MGESERAARRIKLLRWLLTCVSNGCFLPLSNPKRIRYRGLDGGCLGYTSRGVFSHNSFTRTPMGLRLAGLFFAAQTEQTEMPGRHSGRRSTRSIRPVKLTKVRKKILLRADFFKSHVTNQTVNFVNIQDGEKKPTTQNEIFITKKYIFSMRSEN